MKLRDRARGKWELILTSIPGIDERILSGKHMPCPACGGEDRFRYKRDEDGGYFCSSHRGDGLDLVQHLLGVDFRRAAELVESVVGKAAWEKPELTIADRVRQRASKLTRSAYLRNRGLEVPPGLQCVRSLDYWGPDRQKLGSYPAILAPLTREGRFVTYQAVYLHGGQKAPVPSPKKIMPGRAINGALVRLYPKEPVLGVAEGFETAIAASMLHGMPVWAGLTATGMAKADIPDVEKLVIFADNDENFAGHAAAYRLAHRAKLKGLQVEIRFPETVGEDWNDVLLKELG